MKAPHEHELSFPFRGHGIWAPRFHRNKEARRDFCVKDAIVSLFIIDDLSGLRMLDDF